MLLDPPVCAPGGNASNRSFRLATSTGLQDLLLGHAPVVIGLLNRGLGISPRPEAVKATPTNALTS